MSIQRQLDHITPEAQRASRLYQATENVSLAKERTHKISYFPYYLCISQYNQLARKSISQVN